MFDIDEIISDLCHRETDNMSKITRQSRKRWSVEQVRLWCYVNLVDCARCTSCFGPLLS